MFDGAQASQPAVRELPAHPRSAGFRACGLRASSSLRAKLTFLATTILIAACATSTPPPARTDTLDRRIEQIVTVPALKHAVWGILVEEADGSRVYERNADFLMTTASNRKLFISALAYECFPLDSRIATDVLMSGTVSGGVLIGDLIIRGDGDPSLAGRYEYSHPTLPGRVAASLRERGVSRISGRVIADVSAFDDDTIPGSWKVGNLGSSYSVPTDALTWNENVVGIAANVGPCVETITSDPWFVNTAVDVRCVEGELEATTDDANNATLRGATIHRSLRAYSELVGVRDAALYAAQAIDRHLRFFGFEISGDPATTREPLEGGTLLVRHESPFLGQLLATVLKNSQNLYAEALFKGTSSSSPKSYEGALSREALFLTSEVGLDSREFSFADGSGLSPEDRASPRGIVKLLRHMAEGERGRIFWKLLATPGDEGTLRRRLSGLDRRLRAKTGTIHGVAALSGWIEGERGGRRFFSILVNQHTDGDAAVEAIDKVVREVAKF